MRYLILLSLLFLFSCTDSGAPDRIFVNGTVLTVDPQNRTVGAVAVKEGVILAVGSNEQISSLADSNTQVVSLDGQTMVPGFIAAHEHPTLTAVFADTVDLSAFSFDSSETMWQHLKEQIAQSESGDWVYGMGLDPVLMPDLVLPTKRFLDKVSPDNPLIIISQTMHSFWANSKAFEAVGITSKTADPGNGSYYGRDENGELNGFISESEAATPMLDWLKSPFGVVSRYQQELQNLVNAGFTSVGSAGFNLPPMMARYASSNYFSPRIRQFIYLAEHELEHLPESPERDNDFYRIVGIKLWHDGSPYTGSMALNEPYLNNELTQMMGITDGHKGTPRLTVEEFEQQVTKHNKSGWQLAVHSQGDFSSASAVNSLNNLMSDKHKDKRHRFEHCLLIETDTLEAFKQQGLTPSFHINHILYYGDALNESIIGEQRAQLILPLKTAFDLGLHPTLHADTPMFPADPLSLMKTAVLRQTKTGLVLGENQKITPQQALRSMTINGAWQFHMEDKIGSIEVGKSADLTILSENIYQLPAKDWGRVTVNQVWLNGELKSDSGK